MLAPECSPIITLKSISVSSYWILECDINEVDGLTENTIISYIMGDNGILIA